MGEPITRGVIELDFVIGRLREGRTAYKDVGVDLLREVVLVADVCQGDNSAARRFLDEFQGQIDAIRARAHPRAAQRLEGFAAELLVPRPKTKTSRLDSFQGRAPLKAWLKSVVRNELASPEPEDHRQPAASTIEADIPDPGFGPDELAHIRECADLIAEGHRRAFAVLDRDYVLAWRMWKLDGVDQKVIADLFINRKTRKSVNKSTICRWCDEVQEEVTRMLAAEPDLAAAIKMSSRAVRWAIDVRVVEALRASPP
jgi:hypothetical protein